jgi:hypothetical protein
MDETISTEKQTESLEKKFNSSLQDNSTYRNCAGFVSYMSGLNDQETLVNPNDLAKQLKENGRVELDSNTSLPEEEYISRAKESDIVSVLVDLEKIPNPKTLEEIVNNTRSGLTFVHFALIDPEDKTKVYARPDLEKKPSHSNWKDVLNGIDEFKGMKKYLVFFNI